jgi:hypothetical protein
MPYFKAECYTHLKAIETLVTTDWLKKRYKSTCLVGTENEDLLDAIQIEHLITWRWMSVVNFCTLIAPLLPGMVATWNPDKFMFVGDVHNADPEQKWEHDRLRKAASVEVKAVTLALHSKTLIFFICTIVVRLSDIIKFVYDWVGGCPCHEVIADAQVRRTAIKKVFVDFHMCLCSGCRLPELAAGFLKERLRDLFNLSDGHVMVGVAVLAPTDQRTMIDNWNLGRDCLHLGLIIKFGHYDILPWKMFGMGHHDEVVARVCMNTAVQLWQDVLTKGSGGSLANRQRRGIFVKHRSG